MTAPPPKAAIFDLDGTLLNTLDDIANAMNQTLRSMDLPEHPEQDYRWFVGKGMEALARRVLPQNKAHLLGQCCELMKTFYAQNWKNKTKPYEGIPSMLGELAAKGVVMAVLSNKDHGFTCRCVSEFFPTIPFQQVVGVGPNTPPKPNPQGLQGILKGMNLPPEAVLYMGDTSIDMETAATENLFSVGVSWGFRPQKELEEAGARAIIHEPHQLLTFFQA